MSKVTGFTAHPSKIIHGAHDILTVEGEACGPFIIHPKRESDLSSAPAWTVTHKQTGYSVVRSRTRARARTAANAIKEIGVSWDFEDPNEVKKWPKDLRKKIAALSDCIGNDGDTK